jgi:hypothetical protein
MSSAVTSSAGSSPRAARSSSESNTTARPVWVIRAGEAAACLMTAPRGARLPRNTAMPPVGLIGFFGVRITVWLGTISAASITCFSVRPATVMHFSSRCARISRIRRELPPAQWKCSM